MYRGLDGQKVAYHFQLLYQAGLIDANIEVVARGMLVGTAHSLTWNGHEFLARINRDEVWERVLNEQLSKSVTPTFDRTIKLADQILEVILVSER
jgi:hypothetical protein